MLILKNFNNTKNIIKNKNINKIFCNYKLLFNKSSFLVNSKKFKLITFSNKYNLLLPQTKSIDLFIFLTLFKRYQNHNIYSPTISKIVYKTYLIHLMNFFQFKNKNIITGRTVKKKIIKRKPFFFLIGIQGIIIKMSKNYLIIKKIKKIKLWKKLFSFFNLKKLNFVLKYVQIKPLKIKISRQKLFTSFL